eukprot:COSAG02_NODE_12496_length_1536_cov_2.031315_1_plen_162_part_00
MASAAYFGPILCAIRLAAGCHVTMFGRARPWPSSRNLAKVGRAAALLRRWQLGHRHTRAITRARSHLPPPTRPPARTRARTRARGCPPSRVGIHRRLMEGCPPNRVGIHRRLEGAAPELHVPARVAPDRVRSGIHACTVRSQMSHSDVPIQGSQCTQCTFW